MTMETPGQWEATENQPHHEGHEEHEGVLMDAPTVFVILVLCVVKRSTSTLKYNWCQQLPFDDLRGFGAL